MAARRVSLTTYDATAACTDQWVAQLFSVPKLGRFARSLVTRPLGEKEFSLRTLAERREVRSEIDAWSAASAEEKAQVSLSEGEAKQPATAAVNARIADMKFNSAARRDRFNQLAHDCDTNDPELKTLL